MIFHNNILCVSGQEIIRTEANPEGLISLDLWKKWLQRGARQVQRAGNGRPSLIDFDTIPPKYKLLIEAKYGNPRKAAVKHSFLDDVVEDSTAKSFFANYKLENGEFLPEKFQRIYTHHASILNAIKAMYANQLRARKTLGGNMRKFWDQATDLCNGIREQIEHKLPSSKSQFKRVYDQYLKEGYTSLISKKFGNTNTEKITPEIENWMIVKMASGRQSIEMIYHEYKQIALVNGWRNDIEASAFRHRITQPHIRQLIDLQRYGKRQFRRLHGQSFKLKKATYSNDVWVSDGTAVNWYYREGNQVAMATTYMVMDSRSRKWLGWAIKKGINKEDFNMQLEAYRMAIRNSGAKPYQLLYDNQGGHKKGESQSFYSALAKVHHPSRAYRPSAKPIEKVFDDFQSMMLSQLPFWSGFGRESHSNPHFKPNYAAIKENIDLLPNYEELVELFNKVVEKWNELDFKGKGSPNSIYASSRNPEEQAITLDELSELFWNMSSERRYQSQGITMRINGEDKLFEVYDENGNVDYNFRRNYLHQKFFIKYDPEWEYSEVELYQNHPTGGYQKIATASLKREVSRSIKDLEDGDRTHIDTNMKAEDEYIDNMELELVERGFNETQKWTSWRDMIAPKPAMMQADTDEEEDPDNWVLNNL